jgi:hypothetical protein
MIDLDDFQNRVDNYFRSGQRQEPAGRIILDMMRALREASAENEALRAKMRRVHQLNAENLAEIDNALANKP